MADAASNGKVSFAHAGETYTLQYTAEEIVTLEDLLDRSIIQIGQQIITGRLGAIRAAMWAGLKTHHPKVTLREALDLVVAIKADAASDKIIAAMKNAFPEAEEGAGESAARPQTADGPGETSS